MEAVVSKAEYDKLEARYNALEHRFKQLLKLVHGSKSERFAPAYAVPLSLPNVAEQMELFEGGADAGAEEVEKQKITYERCKKKKHPGRTKLPEHLPVRRVPLEPEEDMAGMTKIGEEITRKVDYTPGTL